MPAVGRDFQINGESLVRVAFGAHLSGGIYGGSSITLSGTGNISNLSELGLAVEAVSVSPKFIHSDLNTDDYGPEIPADLMSKLTEVSIGMTLIHYDLNILDACWAESMGGTSWPDLFLVRQGGVSAGLLSPAGTLMGAGIPLLSSGCHFMSLNVASPQLNYPWRFRACTLTGVQGPYPLGTGASAVGLTWRGIPYSIPIQTTQTVSSGSSSSGGGGFVTVKKYEWFSSGVSLWDHTADV